MPGIGRPDNADPEALVFQRICDDTAYLVELEKGIREWRCLVGAGEACRPPGGLLERRGFHLFTYVGMASSPLPAAALGSSSNS